MEYGVLCGLEYQRPEARQGAVKDLPGDEVGLACQLRELHSPFRGMENCGNLGVGNCTKGCKYSLGGCPPRADQIMEFLQDHMG